MNTKVVIIAGGKGERLRPLTNKIAKPMVKVGSKPILEHNLDLFKKYGFRDFIFALCYLPETITSYFGDGKRFGVNIEYTLEDPEKPLGTAGAVTLAKEKINETFIATYGDSIRVVDVSEMLNSHKKKKAFATICTYKRFGPDPKSVIIFDESARIKEFKERPKPEELKGNFVWANAAFYIFEPAIFDYIEDGRSVDFGKDVFPVLLADKKEIYAFPTEGYFIDIGSREKLEKANRDFDDSLITI
jgi:NDP-sugar pyrophosphorylase family protein